jgi:hypothetical protein
LDRVSAQEDSCFHTELFVLSHGERSQFPHHYNGLGGERIP